MFIMQNWRPLNIGGPTYTATFSFSNGRTVLGKLLGCYKQITLLSRRPIYNYIGSLRYKPTVGL